uniref:Peptide deformylase n=2 Tax=Cuerna arida TaxID=1464854 RepID=A0A1B6H4U6_9HEMI
MWYFRKYNTIEDIHNMDIQSKVLKLIEKLRFRRAPKPPYSHVVQLGDPVLRCKAKIVEKTQLDTPEFKKLVNNMRKVVKRYKCVGISAPQLGIDLRVMAMTCPDLDQFAGSPQEYQLKGMQPYSYSVWVNPSMKVLDYKKEILSEGCESMRGFSADVARYSRIRLTGWDERGVEKSEELSGWLARIAQHELDHLDGRMYLDIAHLPSLTCSFWDRVNRTGGKVHISYYPNKII